jgi:hypothetical protein
MKAKEDKQGARRESGSKKNYGTEWPGGCTRKSWARPFAAQGEKFSGDQAGANHGGSRCAQ